ncbi:hypothetical protein [Pseudomonas deceptionensis]|jgi:Skp family chaperone for outer membrane proteins|uniref:Uncharacterized protein n=1 Tax=Pseudomonas deceptionensis TaxID=882211 RepID=A0A0J6G5V7_PSEDM|nr:hypothetical protein [Pseudomonas deceptionensis]KMM77868.1 tmRNA [Pseudomonas deceptionensis]SEE18462.1 hypothetical protein SAMN04489800_0149 [Pseudomonas deceptionensis]
MKRTALAGLFISAVMLASPVFAATDLCQINLQKIKDAVVSSGEMSSDLQDSVESRVAEAKAEQAKGTKEGIDNCISLTTQTLQDIADNNKGGE